VFGADAALAAAIMDTLPQGPEMHHHPASTACCPIPSDSVAVRLAEDVLVSESGALAVQLPTPFALQSRQSPGQSSVTQSPGCPPPQPQQVLQEPHAGALWHASPAWLAVRLLAVLALCRSIQAAVPYIPSTPVACASLSVLYTDLTKPRIASPPAYIPYLPQPLLGVLVSAWSSPVAALREAAQLLMPACSVPLPLDEASFSAIAHGLKQPWYGKNHIVVPDERLEKLLEACNMADTPGSAWVNLKTGPRLLAAAPLGTFPERAVLLPLEILEILDLPPEAPGNAIHVLLSAAACAIHSRSVPPQLIPATLSRLVTLIATAPAPNAAAAATLLTSMMRGPEAALWRAHLPPIPSLLERLHSGYLATQRTLAMKEQKSHATPASSPQQALRHRQGAAAPRIWARQLPQRERALALLPDIRRVYSPKAATPNHRASSAVQPVPSDEEVAERIRRMLSLYHTPSLEILDAVPMTQSTPSLSTGELATTLQALDELIAACASLDFKTFMHSFNTRIGPGGPTDPNTPTHVCALRALNGMLHTHAGCLTVMQHITLLAETVLRLLDPSCPARRSACFQVCCNTTCHALLQQDVQIQRRLGEHLSFHNFFMLLGFCTCKSVGRRRV
jgi:hypothetical protein